MVMYFYYLMSAMGPSVQKYLWWKRYDKNSSYQSYNTNYLLSFVQSCKHAIPGKVHPVSQCQCHECNDKKRRDRVKTNTPAPHSQQTSKAALKINPSLGEGRGWQIICNNVSLILTPFDDCRYLTTMQLGQFVTFFIHASLPLFIPCDFPKIFSYVILFHGAMFFLLFANFYRKTYTKKSTNPKKTDINGNGAVKKD